LTGLRFFAAYLVLQHHFTNFAVLPVLRVYTGFGATGVTFFFVLSGFVLTWSFQPSDTATRFYWRRFARIVPLHVITTIIALPVFYSWRDVPYDWSAIGLSFLLLHAWVPTATTYFAGNPASWSLSCEMFFYALHPFIVRPVLRLGLALLGVACAIVLVAFYVVADLAIDMPERIAGWLLYISPLFRVGEFLVGVGLAAALKRGYRLPVHLIPSTILLAGWVVVSYNVQPHLSEAWRIIIADANYPALAICYALIIAATAQLDLRGARSWLRLRPMVALGQWSYALYLIHATIIYAFVEVLGARSSVAYTNVLWLVLISAVAVASSAGLYFAIEAPIEARLRAMLKRNPPVQSPAATVLATR
jgi:peptidoglycan/LPS O-acetylase OafA/YrhL